MNVLFQRTKALPHVYDFFFAEGSNIMTVSELKKYLTEHLVPTKLYQIGGESDGKICLEQENGIWEVFFCDKMSKIGIMCFKDENSACARMLSEITKVMSLFFDETPALA